jgi:GNAT superfamily N-acetyltransferase
MRVAGRDDLDALTAVMTTAFSDDPVWGPYAFPDTHSRPQQPARIWRTYLEMTLRFPWTLVTERCEAAAVWIPPGEPELEPAQEDELVAVMVDELGEGQARVALDAFGALDAAHPHDEPHHYLSLIGTHTDHRGRGIGMALLAECLEVVDSEVSPAYLESTNPANDARYMRHGFEPCGRIDLAGGQVITTMWRPARAAGR